MSVAKLDENSRPTIICASKLDGTTIVPITADVTTHSLYVSSVMASDNGNNGGNAMLDENGIPVFTALSSAGDGSIVEVYGDSGETIVDSYNITTGFSNTILGVDYTIIAQSFIGNGEKLDKVKFCIYAPVVPITSPNLVVAKIYKTSGTIGVDAVPTGLALASSVPYNPNILTATPTFVTFTFSGVNSITLDNNISYFVTLEYNTGDIYNTIEVVGDSRTYTGNTAIYYEPTGIWFTSANTSYGFFLYSYSLQGNLLVQLS